MITRRDFLRSSPLLALSATVPVFVARTARAAGSDKDARALVVVQLDGGNDALNTVVPFADPAYPALRPGLKIPADQLVKLDGSLGLHPSLRPLDPLWQAGHLSVIPGVGYPNPNRSHFASMAIWHTAQFDEEALEGYGWLGTALDPSGGTAYALGGDVPGALRGRRSAAVALNRVEEVLLDRPDWAAGSAGPEPGDDLLAFVRRQATDAHAAAGELARLTGGGGAGYPGTELAGRLELVARLLKADLGARVFYATQGGYDTHSGQRFRHAGLLAEFAGAVAAFFQDLTEANLADRVTLLAFSEFGRTIRENGSAGTDHGTAGAVFLAGAGVKGGVAGASPDLGDLENGEPRMTTDFRRVYAAVLDGWLGLPADALGGRFEPMPLFRG